MIWEDRRRNDQHIFSFARLARAKSAASSWPTLANYLPLWPMFGERHTQTWSLVARARAPLASSLACAKQTRPTATIRLLGFPSCASSSSCSLRRCSRDSCKVESLSSLSIKNSLFHSGQRQTVRGEEEDDDDDEEEEVHWSGHCGSLAFWLANRSLAEKRGKARLERGRQRKERNS